MEMSSDDGGKVTVAYDGGGCKREQRTEMTAWAYIYSFKTWGRPQQGQDR